MSGPKNIELNRTMTREEFGQLAGKITQAVSVKNYKVKKTTKTDEEHVTVEAKDWGSGNRIVVTAGLHDRNIALNIEDEVDCQDILNRITEVLGKEMVPPTSVQDVATTPSKSSDKPHPGTALKIAQAQQKTGR